MFVHNLPAIHAQLIVLAASRKELEIASGRGGERREDGRFPEGTVHALVEARLERFARAADEQSADEHLAD